MCGVQRGRLKEETIFLVVPVEKDMSGVSPCGEEKIFLSFGGEKGRAGLLEEASCTQREHGRKFERRGQS